MARYLITGQGGQLANAFEDYFTRHSEDYVALDITKLDITNFKQVMDAVAAFMPQVIINCAAYNFVDKAEADYHEAYKHNALGPKILSLAANHCGCRLVHYSSDYVFDGKKEEGLYVEEDEANPLNEYGRSKLIGERLVLEGNEWVLILRLSWVFGKGRQNFIYKLLQWAKESPFLRVACDEFSVPTYTETVVHVTMEAVKADLYGLYHLTNSGFCSRYNWASFIFDKCKINKHLHPVSMAFFNLPAKRPHFSAMDNGRLIKCLKIEIPPWQEDVERYLRESNLL